MLRWAGLVSLVFRYLVKERWVLRLGGSWVYVGVVVDSVFLGVKRRSNQLLVNSQFDIVSEKKIV